MIYLQNYLAAEVLVDAACYGHLHPNTPSNRIDETCKTELMKR